MTDECWTIIEDYPNYMISNHGRVLNWKRGRILKPAIRAGYPSVVLCRFDGKKQHVIHRLVAKYYVPNPCGYDLVEHADDVKINNHYTNLLWCTEQYNREKESSKHYVFSDPDGNRVDVFNLRKFCRDNNLTQGCMVKLQATGHKHKGWTAWK